MGWCMEEVITLNGMGSWPVPVKIHEGKDKLVRLTELPQSLKHKAWAEIKTNCPPLAELLKDPALKEIVEYFQADIYIDAQYAPCLPPEPLKGRKA